MPVALSEALDRPGPAFAADAALLASLPDDPSELVWPSTVWNEHLAGCAHPRRCPHVADVVLPEWWVALMRSRTPLHAEPTVAIAMAMARVNDYEGGVLVSSAGAAFARDAARDALPTAPQPVSKSWVCGALAVTGALATWVHNQGEPLTRDHVFAPRTRRRYLNGRDGATHLSRRTRDNYRVRLDRMAAVLLGSSRSVAATDRKPVPRSEAMVPLTRQEEADLWAWSQGLRPASVRHRIQTVIACGLGCGTRRQDLVLIRTEDVTRDSGGVHVSLPETATSGRATTPYAPRVITCRFEWEDRLWALAQACEPGHYLSAPWRDTEPKKNLVDVVMRNVINDPANPPPVDFSTDSLRNTWLLRHLEDGTPLRDLTQAAAVRTLVHIEKLLTYLPPSDPSEVAARLRGRRLRVVRPGDRS